MLCAAHSLRSRGTVIFGHFAHVSSGAWGKHHALAGESQGGGGRLLLKGAVWLRKGHPSPCLKPLLATQPSATAPPTASNCPQPLCESPNTAVVTAPGTPQPPAPSSLKQRPGGDTNEQHQSAPLWSGLVWSCGFLLLLQKRLHGRLVHRFWLGLRVGHPGTLYGVLSAALWCGALPPGGRARCSATVRCGGAFLQRSCPPNAHPISAEPADLPSHRGRHPPPPPGASCEPQDRPPNPNPDRALGASRLTEHHLCWPDTCGTAAHSATGADHCPHVALELERGGGKLSAFPTAPYAGGGGRQSADHSCRTPFYWAPSASQRSTPRPQLRIPPPPPGEGGVAQRWVHNTGMALPAPAAERYAMGAVCCNGARWSRPSSLTQQDSL